MCCSILCTRDSPRLRLLSKSLPTTGGFYKVVAAHSGLRDGGRVVAHVVTRERRACTGSCRNRCPRLSATFEVVGCCFSCRERHGSGPLNRVLYVGPFAQPRVRARVRSGVRRSAPHVRSGPLSRHDKSGALENEAARSGASGRSRSGRLSRSLGMRCYSDMEATLIIDRPTGIAFAAALIKNHPTGSSTRFGNYGATSRFPSGVCRVSSAQPRSTGG